MQKHDQKPSIVPTLNHIHLHLASFNTTKYFWKKKLGKMLIEQFIEFEVKKPGAPGRILLNLAIFITKQKSPM